jgi:CheY-like chemotaxis protein
MRSYNLPCLILVDYNMPGMNGAEILRRLNDDKMLANIPKIIWSTSNSDTYKKLCIDSGADDYIIKPSNIRELTDAIRHMVSLCRFDQSG